jgi:hypothetical protein
MLRPILFMFTIATITGLALPVHAGLKGNTFVTVDKTNLIAQGAVGSARNSPDSVQYIRCYLHHIAGWSSPMGYCEAVDSNGIVLGCRTTDPNKIMILYSMTDYSYIYFQADANGNCTELFIDNRSMFPPMIP